MAVRHRAQILLSRLIQTRRTRSSLDSFKSLTRHGWNSGSTLLAGNQQRRSLSPVQCARLPCASLARLSPCSSYSISTFSRVCSAHSRTFYPIDTSTYAAFLLRLPLPCVPRFEYRMYTLSCARFSKFFAAAMSGFRIDCRLRTWKLVELLFLSVLFAFGRYLITSMKIAKDQYE